MSKFFLSFKEAEAHLLSDPEVILPQIQGSNEQRAIITHWLQNHDTPPFFSDDATKKEWCSKLTAYAASLKTKTSGRSVKNSAKDQMEISFDIPFPPPKKAEFTFIDLFAGIGGFRLAFQEQKGKCVFSCEWDLNAQKTYYANYGEIPFGDIRQFTGPDISDDDLNKLIPDHDVLAGGFPCPAFSLAGVSKRLSLGKKHGFEDKDQGTLVFDIIRILDVKRPAVFFLENVKNLLNHDSKKTFEVIRSWLENELGYVINWQVVDASAWVPQHRERVFIVGYNPKKIKIRKDEIVIPTKPGTGYKYPYLRDIIQKKVPDSYTLGPGTWATLERHRKHHAEAGNGFGYSIHRFPIKQDQVTRTISARYHKDGAEILIETDGSRPRRLTVKEAQQLQGYPPDRFSFPVSDTQAYRQIGNSVAVPAVKETAAQIAKILKGR